MLQKIILLGGGFLYKSTKLFLHLDAASKLKNTFAYVKALGYKNHFLSNPFTGSASIPKV